MGSKSRCDTEWYPLNGIQANVIVINGVFGERPSAQCAVKIVC